MAIYYNSIICYILEKKPYLCIKKIPRVCTYFHFEYQQNVISRMRKVLYHESV